jgi:hypothetical protein
MTSQSSILPINIIHKLDYVGTADLKEIGLGDDGFQYALKTLAVNPLIPICEWVGYHLCRAVKIATPDFSVVYDSGVPAFGSRIESVFQFDKAQINPTDVALRFGQGKPKIEAIFAVDAFLPNHDRHLTNFMWRNTPLGDLPLSFDMADSWLRHGLPFGLHPPLKTDKTMLLWAYLKAQFSYDAHDATLAAIESLHDNWMGDVLRAAPTEWLAAFSQNDTINFWKSHRQSRRHDAKSLLS